MASMKKSTENGGLLAMMAIVWVVASCSASSTPASSRTPDSGSTTARRSSAERYLHDPYRGTLSLSPERQVLTFSLRSTQTGERFEKEVDLSGLMADWQPSAFAQLKRGSVFVAGFSPNRERSGGALLHLEPQTLEVVSIQEHWFAPALKRPWDIDPFPSGEEVAILDREGRALHAYSLKRGESRLLHSDPLLGDMTFLDASPVGDHGVRLWATPAPQFAVGPLMGDSVMIIDSDGDGAFQD